MISRRRLLIGGGVVDGLGAGEELPVDDASAADDDGVLLVHPDRRVAGGDVGTQQLVVAADCLGDLAVELDASIAQHDCTRAQRPDACWARPIPHGPAWWHDCRRS